MTSVKRFNIGFEGRRRTDLGLVFTGCSAYLDKLGIPPSSSMRKQLLNSQVTEFEASLQAVFFRPEHSAGDIAASNVCDQGSSHYCGRKDAACKEMKDFLRKGGLAMKGTKGKEKHRRDFVQHSSWETNNLPSAGVRRLSYPASFQCNTFAMLRFVTRHNPMSVPSL